MNSTDRENIKQAVAQIIFGLTDDESLEKLKEYCTQSIKDGLEESKQQGLKEIEEVRKSCSSYSYQTQRDRIDIMNKTVEIKDDIAKCERIQDELKKLIEKYETTKRMANEVTNNAVINGFECSACGCIVKSININGQWVKNVRFCPNCGGENIQYSQDKTGCFPFLPKANRIL